MDKTPKISSGGYFSLLMLVRLFYSMTYSAEGFDGYLCVAAGKLAAWLIEAALFLPLIILISNGAADVSRLRGRKMYRAAKWACTFYFGLSFSGVVSGFCRMMEENFPHIASAAVVALILLILCVYCASLGIEGIARASGCVLTCVSALIVATSLQGNFEIRPERLVMSEAGNTSLVVKYMLEELGGAGLLPLAAALSPNTKSTGGYAAAGYLAAKLLFTQLFTALVCAVLWEYTGVCRYPMLTLGKFATTDFIRSFDGAYLFFFTVTAVLVGSAYLRAATAWQEDKSRAKTVITAAVAAAFALTAVYLDPDRLSGICIIAGLVGTAVCGAAVLAAAIKQRRVKA